MSRLNKGELLALGFMTFALFLGAGNIIVPAAVGINAGDQLGLAALGFLLTGVGLPLLTVVALARVGGGMAQLTSPMGKVAGTLLAIAVYLSIGPLFATPRTAVVSFEIGVVPFSGNSPWALLIYSTLYFALVTYLVLTPGQVLDQVGKIITPILLVALVVLGAAAIFAPAGQVLAPETAYQANPIVRGFLEGYLTMDALGALVFGVVIATAIRSQGVTDQRLVTRYSIIAGIIAAVGLSLVYLALIYLGATSHGIAQVTDNGGQILAAYVQHTFGPIGNLLLAIVITLACLTTATGLLIACGEYFSRLTGFSYKTVALVFIVFSWGVANQGLSQLLKFSEPALVGLYPLAIVLVLISLANRYWRSESLIMSSCLGLTLVFGICDGLKVAGLGQWVPEVMQQLPFAAQGMGWVLPVVILLFVLVASERLLGSHKSGAAL
ncbi:branched-chain amino acid transport system II carrier protein [Thiopseudomonas alkaliphila]|uniref:branched-chain amino acid transport system II carrier protein n=1 Tax=Thiopseudomonas alkaliphila TaxID=1697053 RepID=UPI00069CF3E4|nr:branched-chain amino acid transport system II carrier protein [Thiopseudomonas alkaliphila]AKX50492.1 branched-chain amino acid transporter [Thiopseudomonas alkaliphila]AKX52341.1 branched-chain amino acid transporter [Thiopseudomonas alkaliphila]AKX54787.1 branched-chain amino acid transporter [Thiopseudomonas alkaliphila]AKX56828.1 branched-chain amino acid transporter [Thiopseudomonas alkaliphila]